ncbi:MAG: Uma2 family endonuclease [Chloroflexi bacterium]|nr:Uma2 family endonuclease [Chloroflexota bacterium]
MSAVKVRRWTREEYKRLAEVGVLHEDDPVELIEGEIVEMVPQGSGQMTGICLSETALQAAFGSGCHVRVQGPLALGLHSEPEPDLAVVSGGPRDYAAAHPGTALLVLEVAEATLSYDRQTKGSLYAQHGIPEYWILDLAHRQLEVYRDPGPVAEAEFGFAYRTRMICLPGDIVSPLARPDARVAVADILP